MVKRIRGAGRRNGKVTNRENREVPADPRYQGHKATKRAVHRNGNVPPEFRGR